MSDTVTRIRSVISKKQKQDVTDVKPVFLIAEKFMKKHNLMLYGGSAINALMPVGHKIYTDKDIPDYDVLSPSSKLHAYMLADIYAKKGFSYIEVKRGWHKGTYKLFVNFTPIIDITEISTGFYERLKTMSKNNLSTRLPVVPLEFLFYSIHSELSRPMGHIERWEKIYPRLQKLYEIYPPVHVNIKPTQNFIQIPHDVIKMCSVGDCIITGLAAVYYYTKTAYPCSNIEILAFDAFDTANKLKNRNTDVMSFQAANDILPDVYQVDNIKIYQLTSCVSFNYFKKVRVISYDGLLAHLYSLILNKSSKLISNAILEMLNNKPVADRFPTSCIGHQETIYSLRKQRWNDKNRPVLSVYRPKTK